MPNFSKLAEDVKRELKDHTAVNIVVFANKLKKAINGNRKEFLNMLHDIYYKNVYTVVKLYTPENYKRALNGEIVDAVITLPTYVDNMAFCYAGSKGLSSTISKTMKRDQIYHTSETEQMLKNVISDIDPTIKFKEFIAKHAKDILEYADEEEPEKEKPEETKKINKKNSIEF